MPFFAQHRNQIILAFKIIYYSLLILTGYAFWVIYTDQSLQEIAYDYGLWSGKIATIIFTLVLLPGIFRRFSLRHYFVNILMMFRRHLGILVYLLVLSHFTLVYTVYQIKAGTLPSRFPTYIIFGMTAHWLLLPLFLTSNDQSVKKLGKWWGRLHKLIYIITWLIFGHLIFQDTSIWSIIIGITALIETISLIYKIIGKPTPNSVPESQT